MALTKDKIIEALVKQHGLVRREASDFVDTFFDDIKTRVSNGERVRLTGTGSLYLKKTYRHRKRRDVEVSEDTKAWTVISFTPSQALKGRARRATVEIARDVD